MSASNSLNIVCVKTYKRGSLFKLYGEQRIVTFKAAKVSYVFAYKRGLREQILKSSVCTQ
jgi:hypothetical protein